MPGKVVKNLASIKKGSDSIKANGSTKNKVGKTGSKTNKTTKFDKRSKSGKAVKESFLKSLFLHIEQCVHEPVSAYENKSERTDSFLYDSAAFVLSYSLCLVPILYYLNYISKLPRSCNINDRNTYCFNNNETFCKTSYESKYTFDTGYGLIRKEKKCVKSAVYEKEKNSLFNLYNDSRNKLLFALRDFSETPEDGMLKLDSDYFQQLVLHSNSSKTFHYPLKKINQRKMLSNEKIDRSKNKDSIFYKPNWNNKKDNTKHYKMNAIKNIL